jgi:hypothetical protein
MQANSSIERLDLSGCLLRGMDVVASLSDMIASNQSLTSLNLSDNRQLLDSIDAASLFRDGLSSKTGELCDLSVTNTGLTRTGPWENEICFSMLWNKYIPLLKAGEHGVAISVWPRIIVTLQEFPSQPALSLIHHVLQVMQWGERANGSVTPLETPYRTDQTT